VTYRGRKCSPVVRADGSVEWMLDGVCVLVESRGSVPLPIPVLDTSAAVIDRAVIEITQAKIPTNELDAKVAELKAKPPKASKAKARKAKAR
jgi:hypothetical protein